MNTYLLNDYIKKFSGTMYHHIKHNGPLIVVLFCYHKNNNIKKTNYKYIGDKLLEIL